MRKQFFICWTLYLLSIVGVTFTILFFTLPLLHLSWLFSLLSLIWIPVSFFTVWKAKLVVLPEWTVVAEWCGKKMEPFASGYHYPFRKFGFFNVVAEVPVNKQTLYILSGVRDNLAPEVVEQYVYGTASNMEPGTGDFLRLLYRVEVKCVDPLALVYNVNNPYDYVAGIIEQKVSLYVHREKSENIIDKFSEQTLASIFSASSSIADDVLDQILTDTGLKLISFIPVDVINTPEVEELREQLDKEQRQTAIIEAQLKNEVQREQGKKKILSAQLENMSVQENIGKKTNDILVNEIKAIKDQAGVGGDEALRFIAREKTLATIENSSKTGNVTYIDDSGTRGNLKQAAALGFAISTTKK